MLTDFIENRFLDVAFGRRAWSGKPANLFFSAFTTGPSDDGTGGVEVTGNGYARKSVAANNTNFSECTDAIGVGIKNLTQIAWSMATGNWGTITHIGIHSAASGGNLLCVIPLATPINISSYTVLKIEAGEFVVTMQGNIGTFLANALLNWFFRGTAMPSIPTFFVGLGTGIDNNGISGEVANTNYARRSLPNSTGNWPVAVNGAKALSLALDLPFATSLGAWGNVTHFGLFTGPLAPVATGGTAAPGAGVDTITFPAAHGFVADDEVVCYGSLAATVPFSIAGSPVLPTTSYFVRVSSPAVIQLAATPGGEALDITAAGTASQQTVRRLRAGDLCWGGPMDNALALGASDAVILSTGAIRVALD